MRRSTSGEGFGLWPGCLLSLTCSIRVALEPSPPRFKLFAALLVLCAVIAYLPAINAGFIWDDDILLTANPQMQSAHGLTEIWLGKKSYDIADSYFRQGKIQEALAADAEAIKADRYNP